MSIGNSRNSTTEDDHFISTYFSILLNNIVWLIDYGFIRSLISLRILVEVRAFIIFIHQLLMIDVIRTIIRGKDTLNQ